MLSIASANPSPVVQAAVYMAGMLGGYLLLTRPEEWVRVREAIRAVWFRNRRD